MTRLSKLYKYIRNYFVNQPNKAIINNPIVIYDIAGIDNEMLSIVPTGRNIANGFSNTELYETWIYHGWYFKRVKYVPDVFDYYTKDIKHITHGYNGYVNFDTKKINIVQSNILY